MVVWLTVIDGDQESQKALLITGTKPFFRDGDDMPPIYVGHIGFSLDARDGLRDSVNILVGLLGLKPYKPKKCELRGWPPG